MKIINVDTIRKRPMEMDGVKDVMVQKPVTSADGSPNFAMRVFTIEKDGHTPYHNHDFEHINYVIDGKGGIKKENGEIEHLEKGSFVLVKPREVHQYMNLGDDPFVMICAVPIEYE